MANRSTISRKFRPIVFIALGVLSAAYGLHGFLVPNGFIDGGVTGISMLLSQATGVPLPYLIALINIPFLGVAAARFGRAFAIRGALAIAALSLALIFIHFAPATDDKLLAAVFGGFFLGAGIGLTIQGTGVLDGTEIMALLINRRSILTVGEVILLFNVIIFGSALLLLSSEQVMYSILTYIAASRTVDYIVHGIEEFTGMLIVTPKNEEVRLTLLKDLNRGVTILKGRTGYTDKDIDILMCVVTRLEVMRVKVLVHKIDPSAFIILQSINDTFGGVTKKTAIHS